MTSHESGEAQPAIFPPVEAFAANMEKKGLCGFPLSGYMFVSVGLKLQFFFCYVAAITIYETNIKKSGILSPVGGRESQ